MITVSLVVKNGLFSFSIFYLEILAKILTSIFLSAIEELKIWILRSIGKQLISFETNKNLIKIFIKDITKKAEFFNFLILFFFQKYNTIQSSVWSMNYSSSSNNIHKSPSVPPANFDALLNNQTNHNNNERSSYSNNRNISES